jgi:membrane-bound serine protease (ClpP class)
MLPINYAGLALILLGIAFFVAEAFVPSYGALGLGGVAAFVFGALLLVDDELPGFGIPLPLIGAVALVSAGCVIAIAGMAARARARPLVSGSQRLVGSAGELVEFGAGASGTGQGWAEIAGERWRVTGAASLRTGERVRVTRVDGLTLEVSAAGPPTGGSSS